jgi:hypothetical protein
LTLRIDDTRFFESIPAVTTQLHFCFLSSRHAVACADVILKASAKRLSCKRGLVDAVDFPSWRRLRRKQSLRLASYVSRFP